MSERRAALVIGAGFGGLAAAIRLQARGYQVTVLERHDQPGGRARVFSQAGFTFDAGPTIITAPFLLDELFALAGKKTSDYIQLVPCDPFYRIVFADGRTFQYSGEDARMVEQVRKFNPADEAGYRKFVAQTERIFRRAFIDLAHQPFSTVWDMLKVAPDLVRLRAYESVHTLAARLVRDESLRMVLSFHPLLVGGNPLAASSIYSMIHYLERKWGVHFVLGGTGALVRALVQFFKELGGELRLQSKVKEVLVQEGEVTGVRLESGESLAARVVVSNADTANLYRKRLPSIVRRHWTNARLERMRYSMGLFLIYFGTNRTYPELAHHTIVLGPRYQGLLNDIFCRKVLAEDFSLYLHVPTRTDPSLAPPGHECFYVLSPVPHLGSGIDWEREKDRYADALLAGLEQVCPDLRRHVVTKKIYTPKDFENDYDAYLGSAFQFEPILTQSAWFRPHNRSEEVCGLYLVGAGTHPGAGLPGVLSSAKVLDHIVPAPE